MHLHTQRRLGSRIKVCEAEMETGRVDRHLISGRVELPVESGQDSSTGRSDRKKSVKKSVKIILFWPLFVKKIPFFWSFFVKNS